MQQNNPATSPGRLPPHVQLTAGASHPPLQQSPIAASSAQFGVFSPPTPPLSHTMQGTNLSQQMPHFHDQRIHQQGFAPPTTSPWVKSFDKASGRFFFHNTSTQETVWATDDQISAEESSVREQGGPHRRSYTDAMHSMSFQQPENNEKMEHADSENHFQQRQAYMRKLRRRKNIFTESGDYLDTAHRWTQITPKRKSLQTRMVQYLGTCFLFETLGTQDRFAIVDVMKKREINAGELLFKQGDVGDYFYLVESGHIKAFKHKDEHKSAEEISSAPFDLNDTQMVKEYDEGGWFGERSLLFQQRRACTLRAETHAVLWMLDRVTFKHACAQSSQSTFETTVKALKSVPLLQVLTEEQVLEIAHVTRLCEYPAGTTIIEKGTVGTTFFVVKSGFVTVRDGDYGSPSRGNKNEFNTKLGPDQFFGEVALLKDRPRAANIVADTDVTLIGLEKEAFISILGPIKNVIDDNIKAFAVQGIKMLQELSTEKKIEVFKMFSSERFKAGEIIIKEGDEASKFYILRSGEAQVTKELSISVTMKLNSDQDATHGVAKRVEVLQTLHMGDFFGEMALLFNKPRLATVTAATECECFVLDKDDFKSLTQDQQIKRIIIDDAEKRDRENKEKRTLLQKSQREAEIAQLLESMNSNVKMRFLSGSSAQPRQPVGQFSSPTTYEDGLRIGRFTNFDLNDFKSLCTLGTGTFGRCKLIIHSGTKVTYALKIQSKCQVMKYNLRKNIFNEKNMLMQINHPFICKCYQTFQDEDYLYLLLELVQGGELFSLLQNLGPRLQTSHHVFYIACVVSAFEALHARNILYRDLKPENLMIDQFGYLKLVDFGFAKVVERRTYTVCGTPEYFSPELVLGSGYGKGNDLWACGILCYELIAGFTPFGNNEDPQSEIYKKIVREELHFPKDCYDQAGMNFISGLLQKQVVNRLGCHRNGINAIKQHIWFHDLDWGELLQRNLKSPWKPQLKNQVDSSNFDKYDETYRLIPFRCDPNNDPFKGF